MSPSDDVDNYIGSLEKERQRSVANLRDLVYNVYPEVQEGISGKILNFRLESILLFAFGSQKQSMCFYFSKALMLKYKDKLSDLQLGKGTIRFTDIDKIDPKVLKDIIKESKEFPFQFSKRGDSTR